MVWLLYTSSPHPKHFALHIAYTCQHSYFPAKVQLTLKDCLKHTLMCFIKWNFGCGGRSPGRSCLTSETSVTSSSSWNKQIGGLLCSCKLRAAHFGKRMLQGVYIGKPHTQENWPPPRFSFAEWEVWARSYTIVQTLHWRPRKATCVYVKETKQENYIFTTTSRFASLSH